MYLANLIYPELMKAFEKIVESMKKKDGSGEEKETGCGRTKITGSEVHKFSILYSNPHHRTYEDCKPK